MISYDFRFTINGSSVRAITTNAENTILQAGLKPSDYNIDIELEPVYVTSMGGAADRVVYWKADVWATPLDNGDDDPTAVPRIRPPKVLAG